MIYLSIEKYNTEGITSNFRRRVENRVRNGDSFLLFAVILFQWDLKEFCFIQFQYFADIERIEIEFLKIIYINHFEFYFEFYFDEKIDESNCNQHDDLICFNWESLFHNSSILICTCYSMLIWILFSNDPEILVQNIIRKENWILSLNFIFSRETYCIMNLKTLQLLL
jgi:hypothetical protein